MLSHDIVPYSGTVKAPLNNMSIGREAREELKAILDFKISTIEIGSVISPMQSLSAMQEP